MYGTRQQPIGGVAQDQARFNFRPTIPNNNDEEEEKEDKKKKEDDRKYVRRGLNVDDFDDGIFNIYRQASQLMEASCEAEYCVRDIGRGYSVHIMKMLAY